MGAASNALSLLVALWLLCSLNANASISYIKATDDCTFHSTPGIATCCCNGDCDIGHVGKDDWIWGMGCLEDFETPSVCSSTEVFRYPNNSHTRFDNGGNCYGTVCNWEKWHYDYECCRCPDGYRSTAAQFPNCNTIGDCVGCTEPWEYPVSTGISVFSWECRRRGLSCNAVDTIARLSEKELQATGSTTARYYGQLLDQACLRSNCTTTALCQRVQGFLSGNPECRNLDGDFDFEQTVLEETIKAPNAASVATAAKEADNAATALGTAFASSSIALGSENPLLSLFIVASGGTDPATWGKTYAGISHFSASFATQIQGYIHDIVKTNNDTQKLESKLITLADQQDRMFRCAFIPNLQVQANKTELLPNPSLAGSLLAPLGATTLRMAAIQVELDRAKRLQTLKNSLAPLGIILPRDDKLIWNPRNWDDAPTLPGLSTNLTELSPAAGDANPLITLSIPSKVTLAIQLHDRDHTAFDPLMARTALLDPASNPSLPVPMSWKVNNHNLQLVAPIAAIYPALGDLAMWNATHVIASNVSAQPILFEEYLTKGQGPGQATTNVDRYTMYKKATVKMQLAKDVLDKYPARDLALYDLVSGAKMEAQFKETAEGGGEWSVDVAANKGSHAGQWGGGGCFGVGLTTEGKSLGVRGRMAVMGNVLAALSLAVVVVVGDWV